MDSLNARQLRGVSRIPCSSCSALPRLDALSLAIASLAQLILKSHVPDDPPQDHGSSPDDGVQVIEGQRRVAGLLEVLVGQDGEILFCKRASVLRHDGDGLGDCVVGAFQSLDLGFQLLVGFHCFDGFLHVFGQHAFFLSVFCRVSIRCQNKYTRSATDNRRAFPTEISARPPLPGRCGGAPANRGATSTPTKSFLVCSYGISGGLVRK